jgi:hypothetical protein
MVIGRIGLKYIGSQRFSQPISTEIKVMSFDNLFLFMLF